MKISDERVSLSVIVPCLNEAGNIKDTVTAIQYALNFYNVNGEIIIVDDGSSDRTLSVASAIARSDNRVRLLVNPANMGIGASFLRGVSEAVFDNVIMIPGDNENDPVEALRYINLVRDVDIIIPFVQNIEIRSRYRRFLSSFFRFIINITFGMNLNYTNGTVIYKRIIVDELEDVSTGFFFQAEILIRLIRTGYLFAETPQLLSVRGGGRTKAVNLKSLVNVILSFTGLLLSIHVFRKKGVVGKTFLRDTVTYQRLKSN